MKLKLRQYEIGFSNSSKVTNKIVYKNPEYPTNPTSFSLKTEL